eukprot:TRINITY_DN4531_c0_g1_i1.p1 TRINITY_DN4531_c0_g1~~TRINITY_DN4531_c0_g1_i1.p1  ORF type:complete len:350 (-),score=34.73 TRINITY_DN4531_c0_g1_i1:148-1197(-)
MVIKQVTLGGTHMVVLDTLGRVFSRGTFRNNGSVVGHHWDHETSTIIRYQRTLKQLKFMDTTYDKQTAYKRRNTKFELPQMVSIATGINHFLMLAKNGEIWEMGVTKLGQRYCARNIKKYLSPQLISMVTTIGKRLRSQKSAMVKFKKIACGNHHSLAVDRKGKLYSWGQNAHSQCGHERSSNGWGDVIDQPRQLQFYEAKTNIDDAEEEDKPVEDYQIEEVVAGEHMTVALDVNGNVWTCGRNVCQQLGRKTRCRPDQDIMRMVTDLKGIAIDWIGCASVVWFAHNKMNGSVYVYGDGTNGRAGIGKWRCAQGRPVFDEHNFDLKSMRWWVLLAGSITCVSMFREGTV